MTDIPPPEAQESTEAFIEYLQDNDAELLGEYLEMLKEDYYDDNLTDSGRYFNLDADEDEVDISSTIDLAVFFGFVWEREDPAEAEE
jgi:hypothetical protein